jgi:hypothetical protein
MGVEIGKNAAEKSKGLFAAEDWQCSKCGNVNWARRGTCNGKSTQPKHYELHTFIIYNSKKFNLSIHICTIFFSRSLQRSKSRRR